MSDLNSCEILEPPPELKTIIDNTAKYVAKNGVVFEDRIKTKQTGNPKFKFLFQSDYLHPYYLSKVEEFRISQQGNSSENRVQQQQTSDKQPTDSDDGRPRQQPTSQLSSQESATRGDQDNKLDFKDKPHSDHDHRGSNENGFNGHDVDEKREVNCQDESIRGEDATDEEVKQISKTKSRMLDEYIEEKTLKLAEPPDLNFLARPASSITLMEADIIKLTARYIATYGRSFMLDLINREHGNPIFDFTKPQHGQFTYLTNLIMQYALIINHPLGIVEELQKDISSQKQLVDKFKMRTEWQRMLDKEKKDRELALEQEKLLYSQIDWHDFVIVETIDYQPNEKGEIAPTTADQVGTRSLIQQRLEQTQVVPEEMDIDMDEDSDS